MFNLNKIQKLYNIVKCNNLHFHNVEKVPVRSITKKHGTQVCRTLLSKYATLSKCVE